MSRLMKEKTYPERTVEYTAELRCDICGRKAPNPESDHPWVAAVYGVSDVKVGLHMGTQYPESGSGEDTCFDICPTCFTEKLIPALFALGAAPHITEWGD